MNLSDLEALPSRLSRWLKKPLHLSPYSQGEQDLTLFPENVFGPFPPVLILRIFRSFPTISQTSSFCRNEEEFCKDEIKLNQKEKKKKVWICWLWYTHTTDTNPLIMANVYRLRMHLQKESNFFCIIEKSQRFISIFI